MKSISKNNKNSKKQYKIHNKKLHNKKSHKKTKKHKSQTQTQNHENTKIKLYKGNIKLFIYT